jgi:hypothetical protein
VKRILIGAGIVLLALVAGIAIYFLLLARGIGGVDDWTVRRVVAIVNNALEPQLDFDAVSLAVGREANEDGAPYAIRFEGVTLTAPDGTEVVRAAGMRVSLAEMPRRDRPVIIETITLESPEILLIREQRAGGTTGFRGLVPFVKPSPTDRDLDPDSEGATTLSDVLALRRIAVTDAAVVYEDRSDPDLSVMRLDGIGFELVIDPQQTEDGRTLHALELAFGRAPFLEVALAGRVDLDAITAEVGSLSLRADLEQPESVAALPPQLQRLIEEYEIRGVLSVEASGFVDPREPERSDLAMRVDLNDAHFAAGEYQLPIASIAIDGTLQNMIVATEQFDIRALGGLIQLPDTTADLSTPERSLRTRWSVEGISLTEALRSDSSDDPRMAGIVASSGNATLSLSDPAGTAEGEGVAEVREGRLVQIPVLSDVLAAADLLGAIQGRDTASQDTVDSEFVIRAGGLDLQSLEIVVPMAKFSGTGAIGFDGSIDLSMRGGAVERIPVIGAIAGAITGHLAEYRVTREPGEAIRVRINPLGIGD